MEGKVSNAKTEKLKANYIKSVCTYPILNWYDVSGSLARKKLEHDKTNIIQCIQGNEY